MIADRVKFDNCGNCRFYMAGSDKGGICRRYPPTALYTPIPADMAQKLQGRNMSGAVTGNAVLTAPDNWCGEHQRSAEVAEDKPQGSTDQG